MPRAPLLFACLILLTGFTDCDDDGPKLDPNLKTFEQVQAEARGVATPPAAAPAPPVDDGRERATLRWAVPADRPIAFEARLAPGSGRAVDPARLARGEEAPDFAGALGASSGGPVLTAALEGLGSGEVALRARVDGAGKTADGALGRGFEALRADKKIRANMSGRGFITTDLDRGLRNVLAVMFELPAEPVAEGDAWRLSTELASAGPEFVEQDGARVNQVKLVSLETDAQGRKIALVEALVARHQVGVVSGAGKSSPASLSSALLARGRYAVAEGRWLSLEARALVKGTGALARSSDERLSMSLARAVPKDLLVDPPPKPVAFGRHADDDDHQGHHHDEDGHGEAKPAAAAKKPAAKAVAAKGKKTTAKKGKRR